jgi:hypothetical protein
MRQAAANKRKPSKVLITPILRLQIENPELFKRFMT